MKLIIALVLVSLMVLGANAYTAENGYAAHDYVDQCTNTGIGPIGVAWYHGSFYVNNYHTGCIYKYPFRVTTDTTPFHESTPYLLHCNSTFLWTGLAVDKQDRIVMTNQRGNFGYVDPVTGVYSSIRALGGATGVAVDPISGDYFMSYSGGIARYNPTTNVLTAPWKAVGTDGISFDGLGKMMAATAGAITVIDVATAASLYSVGVSQPDGTALSADGRYVFAVQNNGNITRIDLVDPLHPKTVIFYGGSRGDFATIGPDNCLYATQSDRVVRVTNEDGTCTFANHNADTNPCGANCGSKTVMNSCNAASVTSTTSCVGLQFSSAATSC